MRKDKEALTLLVQKFADGTYSSNGWIVGRPSVDEVVDHLLSSGVRTPVFCKECVHRHERTSCQDRTPDFFCADGKKKRGLQ